jgi:hypothetical protein
MTGDIEKGRGCQTSSSCYSSCLRPEHGNPTGNPSNTECYLVSRGFGTVTATGVVRFHLDPSHQRRSLLYNRQDCRRHATIFPHTIAPRFSVLFRRYGSI